VPVIAYPAPLQGEGMARSIAAPFIPAGKVEIAIRMGFTADRAGADDAYDRGAAEIAGHLAAGRDVAVLCEGDPMLFGSFVYLLQRLAGRFAIEIIPGVTSPLAAAAAAQMPLALWDGAVALVPATKSEAELELLLAVVEQAVVMKAGPHLDKVKRVLDRLGRGATLVERVGFPDQRVVPLAEAGSAGYFSLVLVHGKGRE
jgi:precorrin-2/cobalt-factor-2 C20-methyltransferase